MQLIYEHGIVLRPHSGQGPAVEGGPHWLLLGPQWVASKCTAQVPLGPGSLKEVGKHRAEEPVPKLICWASLLSCLASKSQRGKVVREEQGEVRDVRCGVRMQTLGKEIRGVAAAHWGQPGGP